MVKFKRAQWEAVSCLKPLWRGLSCPSSVWVCMCVCFLKAPCINTWLFGEASLWPFISRGMFSAAWELELLLAISAPQRVEQSTRSEKRVNFPFPPLLHTTLYRLNHLHSITLLLLSSSLFHLSCIYAEIVGLYTPPASILCKWGC